MNSMYVCVRVCVDVSALLFFCRGSSSKSQLMMHAQHALSYVLPCNGMLQPHTGVCVRARVCRKQKCFNNEAKQQQQKKVPHSIPYSSGQKVITIQPNLTAICPKNIK